MKKEKDPFWAGCKAGFIAALVKNLVDYLLILIHLAKNQYLDYASFVLYNHRPTFWFDGLFAGIGETIFAIILGIVFVYLLDKIGWEKPLLKGFLYGVIIWAFLYTLGHVFRLSIFLLVKWPDVIIDFFTSSLYGIILALYLQFTYKAKTGF